MLKKVTQGFIISPGNQKAVNIIQYKKKIQFENLMEKTDLYRHSFRTGV